MNCDERNRNGTHARGCGVFAHPCRHPELQAVARRAPRFEPLKKAYGVGLARCAKRCRGWWSAGWSRRGATRLPRGAGSIEDIQDISYVRTNVECLAFRQSIEHGDDQWQADVVAAHYRLNLLVERNATEPVDEELWEARHRDFILRFCRRAARAGCCTWWRCSTDQFDRYRRLLVESSLSGKPVSLEHQRIVDAALKRDGDLADRPMKDHIAHATRLIIENWHAVENLGSAGTRRTRP